jgi:hypothetical protein
MNINSALKVEWVGDQLLALDDRHGLVHQPPGAAATVIDCVIGATPSPSADSGPGAASESAKEPPMGSGS